MKKTIIILTIISFVFSFLNHFLYEWFPNSLTAIFFPVNESIFEHMKLIPTSIFMTGIVEYIFYRYRKLSYSNFLFSLWVSGILGIVFYLIIYLPIHYFIGHSMVISIALLFLTFFMTTFIHYYFLKRDKIQYQSIIVFILIILEYTLFGYLSYHPIIHPLFLDTEHNKYGIHTYQIKKE